MLPSPMLPPLRLWPTLLLCLSIGSTAAVKCKSGQTASKDACCVWFDVYDDVQKMFSGGKCDEVAHDALRLTFHDAIGWSSSLIAQKKFGGGGADGSIIKFASVELSYPGNKGLQEIVEKQEPIAKKHGVSYGDIIQFAGAVSVRNCAGGPRLKFLAGRPDAVAPAPNNGLLPDAADSVETIIARMADAKFSASELVDLLASHSIGFQEHVDPSIEFTPFDSSVEVMDTQFYLDVLLKGTLIPGDGLHSGQALSPIRGEFRLQSDHAIARHPSTACRWQSFIADHSSMVSSFSQAMAKLAVLGQDTKQLIDCSEAVPAPSFNSSTTEAARRPAKLPPGKTRADIEFSCPSATKNMDSIETMQGPATEIPRAFGH